MSLTTENFNKPILKIEVGLKWIAEQLSVIEGRPCKRSQAVTFLIKNNLYEKTCGNYKAKKYSFDLIQSALTNHAKTKAVLKEFEGTLKNNLTES